jgi:hypothetical protein
MFARMIYVDNKYIVKVYIHHLILTDNLGLNIINIINIKYHHYYKLEKKIIIWLLYYWYS